MAPPVASDTASWTVAKAEDAFQLGVKAIRRTGYPAADTKQNHVARLYVQTARLLPGDVPDS